MARLLCEAQAAQSALKKAASVRVWRIGNRPQFVGVLARLEPDEGKLSSPVLRGGVSRKAGSLPDSPSQTFDASEKTDSLRLGWTWRRGVGRRGIDALFR